MLLRAHVSWRLRQLRLLACLLALHVVRLMAHLLKTCERLNVGGWGAAGAAILGVSRRAHAYSLMYSVLHILTFVQAVSLATGRF